jgi:hypothetical protein
MRHLFGDECKYYVHGEDWGSIIASALAQMYPIRVSGIHITMASFIFPLDLGFISSSILTDLFTNLMLTEQEKQSNITFSFKKRFNKMLRESGYMHIQGTKPDTVGVGLTDSPAGLMAYILEKYSTWSYNYDTEIINHHDGSLDKFQRDDLLTIVTLYWMTNTITSSMRYYKCSLTRTSSEWLEYNLFMYPTPKGLPVGITYAPHELDHTPYSVLKQTYPTLCQYNILKNGGHFGLFHNPTELLLHIVNFIDSIEVEIL